MSVCPPSVLSISLSLSTNLVAPAGLSPLRVRIVFTLLSCDVVMLVMNTTETMTQSVIARARRVYTIRLYHDRTSYADSAEHFSDRSNGGGTDLQHLSWTKHDWPSTEMHAVDRATHLIRDQGRRVALPCIMSHRSLVEPAIK